MSLFGFTPQEYKVIEELMKVTKEIYVTICTDDVKDDILQNGDTDIFYSNKVTLNKLIQIANLNNVELRRENLSK